MLHLRVHPDNPQPRLISRAVERIRAGDVVVYPTTPLMPLVVAIGNKHAHEAYSRIRQLMPNTNMHILCHLSDIVRMPKSIMRCIAYSKTIHQPLLLLFCQQPAKSLSADASKKKTIGLLTPSNPIRQMLLQETGRTPTHLNLNFTRPIRPH